MSLGSRAGTVQRRGYQIPADLRPSDFDWGRSRPLKMWRAFRPTDNEPVYWQFGWIEVFRDDVSGQFCGVEKTQATAPEKKRRGPGKKTARELVRRVIGQIYAGSLPELVSDKVVCGQVKEKFKELKFRLPSDATIGRAIADIRSRNLHD